MFLLKQYIFFLFFVIGANARMDPQLLSDIARIFLSHFNDANPNYILSYLPKKGIYVNIENILPTVYLSCK